MEWAIGNIKASIRPGSDDVSEDYDVIWYELHNYKIYYEVLIMMKFYNATLRYWQGHPSKIAKSLCLQSQEYKSFEILI